MDKLYLDHVSYVYSAGTPYQQVALDDVSVGIREGCITGIIGHTGSGKSTMMQMLNGLIKPKSGRILLDGYDINSTVDDVYDAWSEREEYAALSPRKRKKAMQAEIRARKSKLCFRVGLVMQYPEYQLFEETVYADIAFGPRNMGLEEAEIHARVLEAAAFCDIGEELLQKSPFDLSGGQKRRVALAGVIAMRPRCIIFDESTAMLDPIGRREVISTMQKLNKEENLTVINITHYMDEAAMADRIIVLNGGSLIIDGTPEEVFSNQDKLTEIGLDVPQSVALANKLKAAGIKLEGKTLTPDSCAEAIYKALIARGTQS